MQKGSFLALLTCLLCLIIGTPLLRTTLGSLFSEVTFTAIFLSAIYAISKNRLFLLIGLALVCPAIGIHWYAYFSYSHLAAVVALSFSLCFLAYVVVIMTKEVFFSREVTFDLIFGSLCIYFLIGFFWSLIYVLTELLIPGSFAMKPMDPSLFGIELYTERVSQMLYFSLVTLTTLGYGDITPLSDPAETFSTLEAIIGQFYIATFVAGIVGLILRKPARF